MFLPYRFPFSSSMVNEQRERERMSRGPCRATPVLRKDVCRVQKAGEDSLNSRTGGKRHEKAGDFRPMSPNSFHKIQARLEITN